MLDLALQAFRNMLMDILQLAAGCVLPLVANLMEKRGLRLRVEGKRRRVCAVFISAAAGMLLPFGSFGAVPAMASLWLAGLDLPLAAPLLVSNFLFNLSMPLTDAVFVWSGGTPVRIALAFVLGALTGLILLRTNRSEQDVYRRSIFERLFTGQKGRTNYLLIFRDYMETAGLTIVAAAILKAVLASGLFYWLQTGFLTSGLGLSTSTALSKLNIFSPFFGTSLDVLARLVDFSALAALVLLLRFKSLCKLYGCYIAAALVLAASLFIH